MTNAIFTGGVNHGVICINLTSINSRKSEACWRASTEGNGFAGRSTPTMAPAALLPPAGRHTRIQIARQLTSDTSYNTVSLSGTNNPYI